MGYLEAEIAKGHDKAALNVSLPAACLYERRSYKSVGHGCHGLGNDIRLMSEMMEKFL